MKKLIIVISGAGGIDFPSIVLKLTGGRRETQDSIAVNSMCSPLGSTATEPEFAAKGGWSGRRR